VREDTAVTLLIAADFNRLLLAGLPAHLSPQSRDPAFEDAFTTGDPQKLQNMHVLP
jgi:hypothetical protein